MNSACEACGRYDDGSDGTLAGDYRARRNAWQKYLQRQYPDDFREYPGERTCFDCAGIGCDYCRHTGRIPA